MIQSMIVKELRLLFRLRTIIIAALLLAGMLALSLWSGYRSYSNNQQELVRANNLFRHQWEQLTIGNTHGAAHYGTWLFKPQSALSTFDRGITDYTGIAYRVEAHKQHDLLMQTAPVLANYLRFGTLTMATVLQVLMPLLLIFLLFDIHTSEKRLGTLPLLYIQGAGKKNIIIGKAIAALVLTAMLLLPVMLLLLCTGFIIKQDTLSHNILSRVGYLLTGYFLYGSFFALLSVGVSIVSRSSRQSLLSLLGLWLLLVLVLPRMMAGVQERQHPAPSQYALQKKISDAEKYGLNGKEPLLLHKKKVEDSLLARYQVSSIDKLPVNADAIYMQSEEDYMQRIYEKYTGETDSIIRAQNSYVSYARWIDPLFAIREWSMALAATDIDHVWDFRRQAVAYRNDFIRQLNNKLAETAAGAHSNTAIVTAAYYKQMRPFSYHTLSLSQVLLSHKTACLALGLWFLLAAAWFYWLTNRKNIL
jgi:ABC-2 type transport system permease protein